MLLVPKQLRRTGMTGDVPYYGGRFTPAQAYAASHPHAQPRSSPSASLQSLEQLHADGVLSDEEYAAMRARVRP